MTGNCIITLLAKGLKLTNCSVSLPNTSNPALQKVDTDVKIATNTPFQKELKKVIVLYNKHIAPTLSITKVNIITFLINFTTPCMFSLLRLSFNATRSLNVIFFRKIKVAYDI